MRGITFYMREGGGVFAELQCSEFSPSVRLCPLFLPIKVGWR